MRRTKNKKRPRRRREYFRYFLLAYGWNEIGDNNSPHWKLIKFGRESKLRQYCEYLACSGSVPFMQIMRCVCVWAGSYVVVVWRQRKILVGESPDNDIRIDRAKRATLSWFSYSHFIIADRAYICVETASNAAISLFMFIIKHFIQIWYGLWRRCRRGRRRRERKWDRRKMIATLIYAVWFSFDVCFLFFMATAKRWHSQHL